MENALCPEKPVPCGGGTQKKRPEPCPVSNRGSGCFIMPPGYPKGGFHGFPCLLLSAAYSGRRVCRKNCLPSPPLEITVAHLCPGCFRFEGTAGVRMQDRSAEKNFFRSLPSPRCRRINRCRHQTAGNTGRMQAYRKKGQGGNNHDEDYGTERAADDRRARAEAE